MGWVRATFKDQRVWARVDDSGHLEVQGGRVPIRYSKQPGAKVYRAGASRVSPEDGASIEELPDGAAADKVAKKKSRGSGFGSAGTRSAAQAAAAVAHARQQISELDETVAKCFTDGACRRNPGPAGSGVVALLPDGRRGEVAHPLGTATNNIAELTAIALALELLDEAGLDAEAPAVVFTDSSYSLGVLCKGWKAKKNQDLIGSIRERLAARPGVSIQWVAGHVGLEENERADALASSAANGASRREWTGP